MSTPRKNGKDPKAASIILSPEDQEFIERIKKAYGLQNQTDCMRLALRETVRKLEQQVTAA